MVFTTERLQLRWPSIDDAVFFHKLMNQESWKIHIGDRKIESITQTVSYIEENLLAHFHQWNMGFYAVILQETMAPIGICGIIHRDGLSHPDLGFALLDEYVGNGYVFEAAQEIMRYTQLKHPVIDAITSPENSRSQNLLTQLGFKKVGFVQIKEDDGSLLLFRNESISN